MNLIETLVDEATRPVVRDRSVLPVVKFKRLRADAKIPTRATSGSAGLDLYAWFDAPEPEYYYRRGHGFVGGERKLIMTGVAIEIPTGFEGQIRPRSGLALNYGITVLNSPGTIDSDFRGEIGVVLFASADRYFVSHGDRIAQLVIAPVVMCEPVEVDELGDTVRGGGGLGSTGVRDE